MHVVSVVHILYNDPPFFSQRVMATGLFILMRFFLRVDGVLVRLNDTRIYHQVSWLHWSISTAK